jgi:transposase-like protein
MAEKVNKTYRYSYDEKMKIVNEYFNVGGSTYSLARKYNIPRTSIKNWIEKFKTNGYIEQEETRGKSHNGGRISLEDYKERYEILKKYQAFLKEQRERK